LRGKEGEAMRAITPRKNRYNKPKGEGDLKRGGGGMEGEGGNETRGKGYKKNGGKHTSFDQTQQYCSHQLLVCRQE